MKRILLVLILPVFLFSCKQNNGQTLDNMVVQHDTVNAGRLSDGTKKDSVVSNGEYIQYYKNGVVKMRGIMKNGKRDGLWKSFYENGSPWSETTFNNGLKDGKTTTWYENEKKRYEGFYAKDVESGKWVFWNEKGEKVEERNFDK